MRRIIHNSTALLACLSLLTPHFAWAEGGENNTSRPPLAQHLTQKAQEAAREERKAAKKEEAQRKKAQKQAKKEQAAKKDKAQAAKKELAKKRERIAQKEQAAKKKEEQKDQNARRKDGAGKEGNRSATAENKAKQDQKKQEARKKRQEAKNDGRQANRDKDKRDKDRAGKPKNKPDRNAKPERDTADKSPARRSGDDRPAKKADNKRDGRDVSDNKRADRRNNRDAENRDRIRLSNSEAAGDRRDTMQGLNKVLKREVGDGLDESRLTCLSGAAYPCAEGGPVITPGGVVLERQRNGEFVMAPAGRQMYRVNDRGDVIPRVAEEGAVQTEIARQLARGNRVPIAAALLGEGRRGNVINQRITNDNSRSSNEDFATSLRDAMSGRQVRRDERRNNDDDDDDALGKALLLGLGALAVGSMLNNNRQVALSAPDRVVVTHPDGSQQVIKDEVALLRQPGSNVTTENFDDGSSRTIVTRADGSKIVTIRDADLRILRRTLITADGQSRPLIDDTLETPPVEIADLPDPAAPYYYADEPLDEEELRDALRREADIDRKFSLAQIRNIPEVRSLVAPVNIDGVTFETGSAAISADQAEGLATLGSVIQGAVQEDPNEIFLIEGHTDTVGASAANLALSDRRAESVALALTEYYDVPPENLVVQGYGEQYLRVRGEGDIRSNRRASVRRITDLLQTAQ